MSDELPVPGRKDERIAALPAAYKSQHERLAYELAMQLEAPEVIFQRHGYGVQQASALIATPEFSAVLDRVAKDVKDHGLTFRAKARVMAEDLLQHGYEIATDEMASAAVRADLIQWFARVGDLEPEKKDGKNLAGGGGLHLSIAFWGETPVKVVGGEQLTLEGQR